jgi:hypothetical protein
LEEFEAAHDIPFGLDGGVGGVLTPTENMMNRVEFEKTLEVLSGGFRFI